MTTPITIDYLARHPQFVPVIASWVFGYWGAMYRMKSVTEQVEKISDRLRTDAMPLAFVALAGSVPVGTASLKFREMTTHTHLEHWLGTVYVVADHRSEGIGSALVQRAESKARELGVTTLYLHTPDKEHFYLGRGWTTIERPLYFDMPVVVMKKGLVR